jgi:hypothetical protein
MEQTCPHDPAPVAEAVAAAVVGDRAQTGPVMTGPVMTDLVTIGPAPARRLVLHRVRVRIDPAMALPVRLVHLTSNSL